MHVKQAIKQFFRAVGKVIYALFYLFSACTLILFIIWITRIIMGVFDASITAKDYTSYGILAMVGLYIVGKTYYVLSTWKKRRLKAKEDALNEEMNQGRDTAVTTDTRFPTGQGLSNNEQTAPHDNRQRPVAFLKNRRNLPPAPPVKAGNSRW